MPHEKAKTDIQQDITNNIINLLDQVDLKDYEPPFANLAALGIPENPITKKSYQGVNILALWFNQKSKSLPSNKWASFKQWQQIGAHVKKGEKGSRIIFYKTLIKEDSSHSEGESQEIKIPMLRQYVVFNASQVEGFEEQGPTIPEIDQVERDKLIDEFCQNSGADIRSESQEAFYSPIGDYINMPESKLFIDTKNATATENYYATLLHELTHWTGSSKRLNRAGITGKVEKKDYAFEELIAELGCAFLCARLNIKQSQPKDHALYIKSWLSALKDDKTFIFKASAHAARASQYLDDLQCEVSNELN
ncbi:MAG: zincin-like metallopeptidase domain-containing protein [Cytophagales bacterium]|nr:zincin-like metallopeptidase domain-containing protein [Cytophagales bacterium]